jgi:hypothetical protein
MGGGIAHGRATLGQLADASCPAVETVEEDVGALGIRSVAQRVTDELAGLLPVAGGQGLCRALEGFTGGALALEEGRLRAVSTVTRRRVLRVAEEDSSVDEGGFVGTAAAEVLGAAVEKALGLVRLSLHPRRLPSARPHYGKRLPGFQGGKRGSPAG